jgi:hypothetical protein
MTLTPNHTQEEANWADLLDGLRYAGFRRRVSTGGAPADTPAAGESEDESRAGGAKRKPDDPGSI